MLKSEAFPKFENERYRSMKGERFDTTDLGHNGYKVDEK